MMCSICAAPKATVKCQTCGDVFCDECKEIHRKLFNIQRAFIPIKETK